MSIRVKLNYAGFRALRTSAPVLADLNARGARVMAAAGPGHRMDSWTGRNRSRVTVATDTSVAARDSQRSSRLLGALGAGA